MNEIIEMKKLNATKKVLEDVSKNYGGNGAIELVNKDGAIAELQSWATVEYKGFLVKFKIVAVESKLKN